jgi:hypothetical protein
VIVSSLAALNGWILLLGQVPLAAARDGAFPRLFGRTNSHGAPAAGLMVSLGFSSVLLIAQSVGGRAVAAAYEFIVELSTTANMVPYMFCARRRSDAGPLRDRAGGGWRIGPFTPFAVVASCSPVDRLRVRRGRGDVDADPHVPRAADLRAAAQDARSPQTHRDNAMTDTRSSLRLAMHALMVRRTKGRATASGRAFLELSEELRRREIDVISASDCEDALAILQSEHLAPVRPGALGSGR